MAICRDLAVFLVLSIFGQQAVAQDTNVGMNTFYVGGGQAVKGDPQKNDDMPFSFGIMHQAPANKFIMGLDVGFEGTMIDSTWGQDRSLSQGTSFNVLVGGNLVDSGRFKTNAALLLGMRKSVADCPASFLGFQCYADTDPIFTYEVNFGAVVTMSFDKVLLGVRATGESTQLLAGIRF